MTTTGIIVAGLAGFFFGWIWYGPLFGNVWMKLAKMSKNANKPKDMMGQMAIAVIASMVMAAVLDQFVGITLSTALTTAALIWLGFQATILLSPVLWMKKPMKLYWIDSLHYLGVMLIQAAILVAI